MARRHPAAKQLAAIAMPIHSSGVEAIAEARTAVDRILDDRRALLHWRRYGGGSTRD
jgi:hypothetical protein